MSLLNRVNRVLKNETVSRRPQSVGWPLGVAALLIPVLVAISGTKTESVAVEPPGTPPATLPSPYYQFDDAPTPGLPPAPAFVSQRPTIVKNAPSEHNMISLPDYIVEPPDILHVRAVRLIAKDTFAIGPSDEFRISLRNSPPDATVGGTYSVNAEGTIELGSPYGRVSVGGLSLIEAKKAIEKAISTRIKKPELTIQLAKIGYEGSIEGQMLVGPDGTISLGRYGRTYVAGKTLTQAKKAIEQLLTKYFKDPQVTAEIFVYNSKVYYVIIEKADPKAGDSVVRMPVTGNETVLDAMASIQGLKAISTKRVWLSRPGADGKLQTLDVNWDEITRGRSAATNYQMMPGDRLFISDHPAAPNVQKTAVAEPTPAVTVERFSRSVRQRRYQEAIAIARSTPVSDENREVVEWMNLQSIELQKSLSTIRKAEQQEVGAIIGDFLDARLAEQATKNTLRKKVKIQFRNAPLSSVMKYIADEIGGDILLLTDHLAAEGLSPDTPVSLELKQAIPAKTALKLILNPLRLQTTIIGDGIIQIRSQAVMASDLSTVAYHVGDLLGLPLTSWEQDGTPKTTKLDFDNLRNLIRSTVAPDSWHEVGGPGALEFFKGNLSLVISNTQEVHDEVSELLDGLRKLTLGRKSEERIQKFPNESQGEVRVGQSAELPPTRTSR